MFTMTYLKILMMIRGGIIEDKSGNGRNLVIAINPNITDSYIGDGAIIGRNKFHSSQFGVIRLYKFSVFKDVLTQDQIYNVMQKYNLQHENRNS